MICPRTILLEHFSIKGAIANKFLSINAEDLSRDQMFKVNYFQGKSFQKSNSPQQANPIPNRTYSGKIRDLQNAEYQQEEENLRKIQEEQRKKEDLLKEEEDKKLKEKENLLEQKNAFIQKSLEISNEQKEGILYGFRPPFGKRFEQHFDPEVQGELIYEFIRGKEFMFNQENKPIQFTLLLGGSDLPLDRTKTLKSQGLDKKTLFNIVPEDEE